MRKPVFVVSDQVRHKTGCPATENGKRLEILDLGSRGILLSMYQNQRCCSVVRYNRRSAPLFLQVQMADFLRTVHKPYP